MRGLAGLGLIGVVLGASACGTASDGENACGTGKVDANGTRDRSTSYVVGSEVAGCMGSAAETHYYDLTAPADTTGGYVQGSVVGSVSVSVYLPGVPDKVGEFVATGPDATSFFMAVAPGQDYQLGITNGGAFTKAYDFSLATSYVAVPDTFEPNDTVATAAPTTVGAPLQAYLFAGTDGTDATAAAASDDHYRFSAAAGPMTVRIEQVPSDLAPRLTLFSADGSELARVASGQKGAVLMMAHTLLAPGEVVVRVSPWSSAPPSIGTGATLPIHFTQPYTLTITQP